VEISDIYQEKVKRNGKVDHIRYYFFNEKGTKIRAKEKDDIIKLYNKFRESKGEELIPIMDYKTKKIWKLTHETTPMDFEPGGKYYDPDFTNEEPEYYERVYGQFNAVPKEFLLKHFKKMLEENPKLLSQELGIEEISYLPKLKPKKRYALKMIGDYYFYREKYTPKKALSEKMLRASKQYWREFIRMNCDIWHSN
jgi:hypothetical protein